MRTSRLRIQWVMVLIALTAILITIPAYLCRRAIRFEHNARDFRQQLEEVPFGDLEIYLFAQPTPCNPEWSPEEHRIFLEREEGRQARSKPLVLFHEQYSRLEEKYRYAASHPWLPIALDDPLLPIPSLEYRRSMRADLDRLLEETNTVSAR